MKKFLKTHRLLICLLSLPYIIVILSWLIHINYDVTLPATIDEIENVISIANETELDGSINVVSVYSYEKINILSYVIAKMNPYASIDLTNEDIIDNYDELYEGGVWQKKVSLYNAIIAGYHEAGMNIDYTFEGYIVHTKTNYLDDDLDIGDCITHINHEALTNDIQPIDLISKNRDLLPTLTFTIIKDYGTKNEKTVDVEITGKTTEQGYVFGFSAYALNIPLQTPDTPSFTINWHQVKSIGPSGGLLQSFYVYEKLTNATLSKGIKIAGTGTVDINGNAGPIGGITQKIYTAELSGVDVFFVPVSSPNYENDDSETNYIEAKKAYESLHNPHMKMVPVSSLGEIISFLKDFWGIEQ